MHSSGQRRWRANPPEEYSCFIRSSRGRVICGSSIRICFSPAPHHAAASLNRHARAAFGVAPKMCDPPGSKQNAYAMPAAAQAKRRKRSPALSPLHIRKEGYFTAQAAWFYRLFANRALFLRQKHRTAQRKFKKTSVQDQPSSPRLNRAANEESIQLPKKAKYAHNHLISDAMLAVRGAKHDRASLAARYFCSRTDPC